jgi:nitrogen fixation protein FixH
LKPLLILAAVAALGAVGLAVYVGTLVREDTVVARPYEESLSYDADRHAREALGWSAALERVPPAGANGRLVLRLRERGGGPLDGAAVAIVASRPQTGRGQLHFAARAAGDGRYEADADFPSPGPWDVRAEIQRGKDHARLTLQAQVPPPGAAPAAGASAASPPGPGPDASGPCDLTATPCTAALAGGGSITLDLAPRPVRSMRDLEVRAAVRGEGLEGAAVKVAFEMKGMVMFPAEAALAPAAAPGAFAGKATLVRCASGRKDWVVRVQVTPAGGRARTAELGFRVEE